MPTLVPQTSAGNTGEALDTLVPGRAALKARQHPELSPGGPAAKATGPCDQQGIGAVKLPRPNKTYSAPYSRKAQQWVSPQEPPHGWGKQGRQGSDVPDASMPHQNVSCPRGHIADKGEDEWEAEPSMRHFLSGDRSLYHCSHASSYAASRVAPVPKKDQRKARAYVRQ